MSSPPAMVLIGTTDRPAAFARLCADLVRVAPVERSTLMVGVVDNSRWEASRRKNIDSIRELRVAGVEVGVASGENPGRPIAETRAMQRDLAREMIGARRPAFIWMLDDDLRMERLCVVDGVLMRMPWRDPLRALHGIANASAAPAVLVGGVHGDPPIPAMATWASRVADLGATLEVMIARGPRARWEADPSTSSALAAPDFYYDYGESAVRGRAALWLPRRSGHDVEGAMREMLLEASFIPDGIGFTRPIVGLAFDGSDGERVSVGTRAQVRGGNTVFFDVGACLAHRYPAVAFEGIALRRADSVGLQLLARRGVTCATSDLALLHVREEQARERPDGASLSRHLVADTLGAALVRAVSGADSHAVEQFLVERVARIEASLVGLSAAIARLEAIHETAPRWARDSGLDELMDETDGAIAWLRTHVPGLSDCRIPEAVRGLLVGACARDWIAATASELSHLDAGRGS